MGDLSAKYIGLSWGVLVFYLVGMLLIGLYFSKRQNSKEEFFLGGQSLGPIVLAGTFAATWVSGGSALGIIGSVWNYGVSYIWVQLVSWVGGFVTILFVVDKMRSSGHITIPALLEDRYESKNVGMISAGVIALVFIGFFITQFKAAGVVSNVFLGLDYAPSLFLMGGVIIVYSAMGGFLAVSYTDVVQAGVVFVGLIIGAIMALASHGGSMTNILDGIHAISPDLTSLTGAGYMGPAIIFQQCILWTAYNCCAAHTAVRYFAGNKRSTTMLGIGMGWLFCTVVSVCQIVLGTSARIANPELANMDYAFPLLMLQMVPWFGAVINVAVIAAVMSTIDSGLLVVCSSLVNDIYLRVTKKEISTKSVVRISRWVTIFAGLTAMLLALRPPQSIFAFYSGCWAIMVSGIWLPQMFGFYTRWANKYGVLLSLCVAVPVALLWTFFKPAGTIIQSQGLGVGLSLVFMIATGIIFKNKRSSEKTLDKFCPRKERATSGATLISTLKASNARKAPVVGSVILES